MRTYRLIIILVLCAHCLLGAQEYESYKSCRECHSDIFKLWSSSLHAKSYSNPAFQAVFMDLVLDKGDETGQLCLRCHAPIAHVTNDFGLKSPSVEEGINCWFCHSISSIQPGADIHNYYNLDTSGVLFGPHKEFNDEKHPLKYSPLHLRSELCAGCHEYTNEHGVAILETYREWKKSPYAKNEVYCQNCHMPIMTDLTAVDGQENSKFFVTAHEFLGGHSNINLANAVTLETTAKKEGNKLSVTVSVTNAESGHKLPTGIPIRKIVLTVNLISFHDIVIRSARRVYRKVLTDKFGTIIESPSSMFLDAIAIYSDNRIAPQETRVENFLFTIPDRVKDYVVETTLNYEYMRTVLKEELVRTLMAKNEIKSRDIK